MAHFIRSLRNVAVVLVTGLGTFAAHSAYATDVTGNVSGTWTPSLNPFVARGDCHVAFGSSLTLAPGVQFLLAPGASLVVDGSLSVSGTAQQPVQIDTADASGAPWRCIDVTSTGQASLTSCILQRGGAAQFNEVTGALRVDGGTLSVMGSQISNTATSGIYVNGGSLNCAGSRFSYNGGLQPTDASIHVVTGNVTLGTYDSTNAFENSVYGVYNEDLIPVYAMGTWWGSASGPQHISNVLGTGCSVSDDVVFDNFVTISPYPHLGDANRDGVVDMNDVILMAQVAGGITAISPDAFPMADVVPDGRVNLQDVERTIRAATGLAPF